MVKTRGRKRAKPVSESESESDEPVSTDEEQEHWTKYWKFVGKPTRKLKTHEKYLDAKWRGKKVSVGGCVIVETEGKSCSENGSVARIVEMQRFTKYPDKEPLLKVQWFWKREELHAKVKRKGGLDHDAEVFLDGKDKKGDFVPLSTVMDVAHVFISRPEFEQKKRSATKRNGWKATFDAGLCFWANRTYYEKQKRISQPDTQDLSAQPSPRQTRSGRVRMSENRRQNVLLSTKKLKRKRGQMAAAPMPTACATRPASPQQPPAKRRKTDSGEHAKVLQEKMKRLSKQKKGKKGNWDRNVFLDAKSKLKLSAVPEKLPCREKEHAEIKKFIKNAIKRGGSGSGLYIAGMPGTGKTATVRQIIRELSEQTDRKKLPEFQYCEINAMKLPTPYHCYSELYYKLKQERVSHNTAVKKLEKRFSTHSQNRKVAVVLLDELDYLVTKKQTVIYNMFDWPTRRHGRMVMIGIANTMDLPERLTQRVQSRLGKRRITFAPYNRGQLVKIIQNRLEGLNIFEPSAVKFCASKVAGVSGDVRRALQIAKRAAEIVEQRYNADPSVKPRILIKDINVATDSLYSSSDVVLLQSLRLYQRMFLVSLVNHTRATGRQEAGLDDLHNRVNRAINIKGLNQLDEHHWERIMDQLHEVRLINLQRNRVAPPQIRLNVQIDDINFSFQKCKYSVELLQSMLGQ